jgi:hypothetical protein
MLSWLLIELPKGVVVVDPYLANSHILLELLEEGKIVLEFDRKIGCT